MRPLAILFALFITGCSVGPAYRHPDPAAPNSWRTTQTVSPDWPSLEWWHAFNSSELDRLMTEAQQANDDLSSAAARIIEADAQARIAGAALLPTVDASADVTRQRQRAVSSSSPATSTQYSAILSASYELDFWGKNRARRNAALALAAASRYDYATVGLTVMTSVATTYFRILELRERFGVARDNLASAQKILDGLHLEQTVGIANALDVAQQETTVAALSATVPAIEQQLEQSVDALAILLGQSPESLHDIAETSSLKDVWRPTIAPGLPSELLARRPDVAQAEAQLKSANANIVAARAAFFPSVDLTADGGGVSSALHTIANPVSRVFALTAGITQPIFAGGALTGQLDYSKGRYVELLADYHKAVISAFANVEDALIAVEQTAEQEQREQVAAEKASRAYDMAQTQLRAGTINILTVLNTESALFTARDALVQANFSHLQALVGLFNALGGGWRSPQTS
jgi:NodT family efflux transporter outer membrane factor (OMF) lipoprotein